MASCATPGFPDRPCMLIGPAASGSSMTGPAAPGRYGHACRVAAGQVGTLPEGSHRPRRGAEGNGFGLKSLQERVDTTSSGGQLIFHLFGTLAEFERSRAGLTAARARGRKGGRKKALTTPQRAHAVELYRSREHTVPEICSLMGILRATLYTWNSPMGGTGVRIPTETLLTLRARLAGLPARSALTISTPVWPESGTAPGR